MFIHAFTECLLSIILHDIRKSIYKGHFVPGQRVGNTNVVAGHVSRGGDVRHYKGRFNHCVFKDWTFKDNEVSGRRLLS